jgi:hypothetical protein
MWNVLKAMELLERAVNALEKANRLKIIELKGKTLASTTEQVAEFRKMVKEEEVWK